MTTYKIPLIITLTALFTVLSGCTTEQSTQTSSENLNGKSSSSAETKENKDLMQALAAGHYALPFQHDNNLTVDYSTTKNPQANSQNTQSNQSEHQQSGSGSKGQPAPSHSTSNNDIQTVPIFSDGQLAEATNASDFHLASVKWLHTDVSQWKETARLSVNISGSTVGLNYDKADVWPARTAVGEELVANPWIFVKRSGQWYAATWEWLRPGQRSKSKRAVAGDHIKRSPLNTFQPVSGETYGFMVSGLARDSTRNVKERSNITFITWP